MTDLTVICVTRDDEPYLPALQEALERQSGAVGYRFLFTDVGSVDRSVEIVRKFVARDGRAAFHDIDAENDADAYNKLLEYVDSMYVLFLQASAAPGDDFFSSLAEQAHRHDVDILVYRSMGANDRTTDFSNQPFTDRIMDDEDKIRYFRSIYGCHCGPDGRVYRTEFLRSNPSLRFETDDAFYIGNHGWVSTLTARRVVVSSDISCPVVRRSRAERRKRVGPGYGGDAERAEKRMFDFFESHPERKEKFLPIFVRKGVPGLAYHKRTFAAWKERQGEQLRITEGTAAFREAFDPIHAALPVDVERAFFDRYDPRGESTKRLYIPINWNYFDHGSDRDERNRRLELLKRFLETLNEERSYFTVAAGRPAKDVRLPKDTIVFSGCGNPLIPSPELEHRAIPAIRRDCRYDDKGRLRPIVASFHGDVSTHPCRKKMVQKLIGNNAYEFGSGLSGERFLDKMQLTEFALCPRGFGPTSFRLYEAMCAGAIPVYISDDYYLPDRDRVDWNALCVFVSFDRIERIPDILAGIGDVRRRKMKEAIREFVGTYLNHERTCTEIRRMLKEEHYSERVLVKPRADTPPDYNLVCYSLFGNDPKYTEIAAKLDLVAEAFPGWTCRFYVDDTLSPGVLKTLESHRCEIVRCGRSVGAPCSDSNFVRPGGLSGMMWRFAPLWEPEVDRFVVQDADDTPSYTFLEGLRRWTSSGKLLYTFHPYPWYGTRASASMFAARGGALCGRLDREQMTELANSPHFQYGDDENWFNRSVVASLRHSWYSATAFRCPELPGKERLDIVGAPATSLLRVKCRTGELPEGSLLRAELETTPSDAGNVRYRNDKYCK